MRIRRILWLLPLAAILGVTLAVLRGPSPPVALLSGTAMPQRRPLGEFALLDQHARPLTRSIFERRWTVVFAGFTNCPDVCPTTLVTLAGLRARVQHRSELQVVFLSVDSERDTPAQLTRYLAHFDPAIIGATGAKQQLDRICADLGLAYLRNPGVAGEYTVDHSAALVLVDPQARIAAYFRPPFDVDALAADITAMAGG
jgi:protein SCO1/2